MKKNTYKLNTTIRWTLKDTLSHLFSNPRDIDKTANCNLIRASTIWLLLLLCTLTSQSQLCPGGGVNLNSAVLFDPAWVYGCTTGTSCNGGVNFDNQSSCEPTTAMDACAPPPSCGAIANNASDIWFKFYPSYPNVTLASVQNASFVIGIQAFEGDGCGSLTEIGCALAGGPSSGVQLSLTGLDPAKLYYYRIFGSGHVASQRSGVYCFCGTQGLQAIVLPLSLGSLKAMAKGDKVALSLQKPAPDDDGIYEIEYSADGVSFKVVYRITNQNQYLESGKDRIDYLHAPERNGTCYYRLRRSKDGKFQYSAILKMHQQSDPYFIMHNSSKS